MVRNVGAGHLRGVCQNCNKGGSLIYITSRAKNVEVKRKSNFVRTADF